MKPGQRNRWKFFLSISNILGDLVLPRKIVTKKDFHVARFFLVTKKIQDLH